MKDCTFTIVNNYAVSPNIYCLELSGDTSEIKKPGEFVEIQIPGRFLRRPFSVCEFSENFLAIYYRLTGNGTELMSSMKPGQALNILTGLGNGFDTELSGLNPVLVGGGVGVTPIYMLCRKLISEGKAPKVVLGFNTAEEIFLLDKFKKLDADVTITTVDGSAGIQGYVTDLFKNLEYTYFYACGPEAMYEEMEKIAITSGQYSMERRMGCGYGVCMGCSIETASGFKRVCKDGPVFVREEIYYEH